MTRWHRIIIVGTYQIIKKKIRKYQPANFVLAKYNTKQININNNMKCERMTKVYNGDVINGLIYICIMFKYVK